MINDFTNMFDGVTIPTKRVLLASNPQSIMKTYIFYQDFIKQSSKKYIFAE